MKVYVLIDITPPGARRIKCRGNASDFDVALASVLSQFLNSQFDLSRSITNYFPTSVFLIRILVVGSHG